jgi:hypothetical protein
MRDDRFLRHGSSLQAHALYLRLDHTIWICKLAEDFLSQDCIRWSPLKTGTSKLICRRSNVPDSNHRAVTATTAQGSAAFALPATATTEP